MHCFRRMRARVRVCLEPPAARLGGRILAWRANVHRIGASYTSIAVLALQDFRGRSQYHGFHPAKDQPSTH
eukprot:scaffold66309_cov68-Phaeocystis_antarctica.AAC.1